MPFFNRDEVAQYLSGIQPGVPGWKGTTTAQALKDMGQALLYTGDVGAGYKEPTLEGAANMALDIMPMSAVASMATKVPAGALGANVFHGGPHRFAPEPDFPHGRPRLDKIGTGEGVQAYGHGFYSADAPDVAKNYAPRDYDAEEIMMSRYKQAESDGDYEAMSIWEDAMMHETPNEIRARYADPDYDDVTRETANRVADELEKIPQKSAFYKLDIPDADVAKYLDYDKPLSKQPKSVRDALRPLLMDPSNPDYIPTPIPDNMPGYNIYKVMSENLGGDQAASEALRKAGIPGLKYFDQGSRAGGEGTRNYVTWDQDVLNRSKMLERDGQDLAKALMEVEP